MDVETRHAIHFEQAETLGHEDLRRHFVVENLFALGEIRAVLSHYDRNVLLGISPSASALSFTHEQALLVGTDDFLERREIGMINIGGVAEVTADGETFRVGQSDALYLGMGSRDVSFTSVDAANPAVLYANSVPAHQKHPNRIVTQEQAVLKEFGSRETSNERKLYQYIVPDVLPTCQLLMGLTRLEPGSVWNTMPAHTHDRRMEAYLYFGLEDGAFVNHLMGRPQATRHLIMRNRQAVLSPPWSIHCGAGTGAYAFIWSMAGDNQSFTDMDMIAMDDLQ